MRSRAWGWIGGLALWAGLLGGAWGQAAALPPAEAFYRERDIVRAALSPSGRWLALTSAVGAPRIGIVVFDTRDWGQGQVAARFNNVDIDDVHWVNDDYLAFDTYDRLSGGGEQWLASGLYTVKRDGSEQRQHTRMREDGVTEGRGLARRELLSAYHHLLQVLSDGGDDVIIGEWRYDGAGELDGVLAKRLNIKTGQVRSLSEGIPPNVRWWRFDPAGNPRIVETRHRGRAELHWRNDDGVWRRLAEYPAQQAPFRPHSIDTEGRLYVTQGSGPGGTRVLKTFDFAKGVPNEAALVSTPGFDFSGGIVSEQPGMKALGVRTTTDAETTVWFDGRMKALQQEADARMPGYVNRLTCRRCGGADMVVLMRSWSDRDPGQVWIYREDGKAWRKVGSVLRDIEPQRMGTTDLVRIQARDGRDLPVWITLPAQRAAGAKGHPAVMLVHGGPWVRGRTWTWNAHAQFLASRGYAVIEPEFRGSNGYGFDHFRAGWRQWGQAMQDDLADALAWAVKAGHVEAGRVCIAGASYGGYATLMGLIRYPQDYRCGIAWAAVTDPRLMFKWSSISDQNTEIRQYTYPELIGDPVRDAAMLDANTPVLHASGIKAPLLLAHGSDDRRVPIQHGTDLREALHKAGRPPEWVFYAGEGHGWLKLENQVDFAQRMERFLAEHLR